jgi:hypothetical protein
MRSGAQSPIDVRVWNFYGAGCTARVAPSTSGTCPYAGGGAILVARLQIVYSQTRSRGSKGEGASEPRPGGPDL